LSGIPVELLKEVKVVVEGTRLKDRDEIKVTVEANLPEPVALAIRRSLSGHLLTALKMPLDQLSERSDLNAEFRLPSQMVEDAEVAYRSMKMPSPKELAKLVEEAEKKEE
jgi:hypothetical protein